MSARVATALVALLVLGCGHCGSDEPVDLTNTEVIHVVTASAGGGMGGDPAEGMTFGVSIDGWCRDGETTVRTKRLYLLQPGLTDAELDDTFTAMREYTPMTLHVRPLERAHGRLEGEIVQIDGPTEHPTLQAFAEELARPVTLEDPTLGPLTLDRELGQFRGHARWGDEDVEVAVDGEDIEDAQANLPTAHALFGAQEEWSERVEQKIVEELLDLHNGNWSESDTPKSAAEFRAALALDAITVSAGGHFEFWFEDGGLFLGHVISVRGTLAEGPMHAGIEG